MVVLGRNTEGEVWMMWIGLSHGRSSRFGGGLIDAIESKVDIPAKMTNGVKEQEYPDS